MATSEKIRVTVPGKGEVTLLPCDHLATGGEGAVFLKNGLVYKLYLDPLGARRRNMAEKIRLLAAIRHPYIVAPIDILQDRHQEMVGYYMSAATGTPLVKLFTNAWRDANGFSDTQAASLVENMRLAVSEAHRLAALMVDGNEMNWLADGVRPQAIDVDSWQIGPFKASAIMASIVDHHAAALSENTDWFAWGIVTFQVFTGIHPYKGTHPDFPRGDMEARMKAKASVFDARVKLNSAVRDFAAIPRPLAGWYEGVFQSGHRSAPPAVFMPAPPAAARTVRICAAGTGLLKHRKIISLPGPIRRITGNGFALCEDGKEAAVFDLKRRQRVPGLTTGERDRLLKNEACLVRRGSGLVFLERNAGGIGGRMVAGEHDPVPASPGLAGLPCLADRLIVWQDRVFAINSRSDLGLTEIGVESLGARAVLSVRQSWPLHALSTRFYDGFAVTDSLGMPFVVLPEAETALLIHRAPSLRNFRLVNGYARSSQCLILHGLKRSDGQLYRLRLRLRENEYEMADAVPVDVAEPVVAVTEAGIGVAIFEDGELSVWNTLGSGDKRIRDPAVTRDMRLFAVAGAVFYHTSRGGRDIFQLSLG